MTDKKEHPHAWALREIADGAPLSDFECKADQWLLWESAIDWVAWVRDGSTWQVRRKVKMHRIGEHTFPAPMTDEPTLKSAYWHASPDDVRADRWDAAESDLHLLNVGVLHATKEAAEAHSKALAAIARGVPV